MASKSRLARDVAIVGTGVAGLQRDSGKALGALVLEACVEALQDAGLGKADIDGIGGVYSTDLATVWPGYVANGLGFNNIRWSSSSAAPSMATVLDGILAVAAGACETALVYHGKYRWDVTSGSAANDPLRKSPRLEFDPMMNGPLCRFLPGASSLPAGMRRHMHEYGTTREHYGKIAINNRTHAQNNPRAIYRGKPLTMAEYLSSPMIQDPMCMLDMDMPIDAASAVVITTVERARDMRQPGVLVKDLSCGMMANCDDVFEPMGSAAGCKFITDSLYQRNGITAGDLDYVSLYDGFTTLCMDWIEATFGDVGDGPGLVDDAFDPETGIFRFLGRIPMNTHGGNLSEGRLQGMGQLLEGVTQLRHQADGRQVTDAHLALVTNAGNPINIGMLLERI